MGMGPGKEMSEDQRNKNLTVEIWRGRVVSVCLYGL